MTNHWSDIDNASLVLVMGANPSENHPACMAHINAARFGSKNARLVVVDPRKTRTALQADLFVRIRPGTDIAFINGMLNYILNQPSGTFKTNLEAWHNSTSANHFSLARTFVDDAGTTQTMNAAALQGTGASRPTYNGVATDAFLGKGWPKYCDSRVKVVAGAAPTDYQRATLVTSNSLTFSNMPVFAVDITDADCVYQKLRTHVAPYTTSVVADICGCTAAEITAVADELIANSRMMSSDFNSALCDPQNASYKAGTFLYAMGQTQHTYGSQNIKDIAILQTIIGNMGRPGGGINALRGIHNVQGSTDFGNLYDGIPGYYASNPPTYTVASDGLKAFMNTMFGNRINTGSSTFLAGKDVYDPGALGLQQRGFYNMTKAWFGDTTGVTAPSRAKTNVTIKLAGTGYTSLANNAIVAGSVSLSSGSGLTGTVWTENTDYSVDYAGGRIKRVGSAVTEATNVYINYSYAAYDPADMDLLYALWPKGNGIQHITAFREMVAGNIKAAVVWGQNPAVTEPNQSFVRAGLKNLDLLVCTDIFENETAICDRKATGVTYLLPACSHVEEAGSVTNSGRWIQWRDRATTPKGNSKADLELLLRLAYALDQASGFAHIKTQWANSMVVAPDGPTHTRSVYDVLYGKHGWSPADATGFEALTGTSADSVAIKGSEVVAESVFKEICQPLASGSTMWIYSEAYNSTKASARPAGLGPLLAITDESLTLNGYEAKKLARAALSSATVTVRSAAGGGTLYTADTDFTLDKVLGTIVWKATAGPNSLLPTDTVFVSYTGRPRRDWITVNRAKSREGVAGTDSYTANSFPRYGYAWLLNRRVFYNNSEVPDDEPDVFVAPGVMARLFTIHTNTVAEFSLLYRSYNTFKDKPTKGIDGSLDQSGSNLTVPHKFPGRFPGHTEPIETPRRDLANVWGRNYDVSTPTPLVKHDSNVALWATGDGYSDPTYVISVPADTVGYWDKDASQYPLVLTTIRCVEHFQGGPITRNNTWNVEAEPVPWIEINSTDARIYGIADGDWVNVTTARSDSHLDQEGRTNAPAGWAVGFKARVGSGLLSNQRVGPGVVAIPWHWGDKGLSTGSRANDLCIDAFDADTTIPEYKACLCKIAKM